MESPQQAPSSPAPDSPGFLTRAVLIFARPAAAWKGLEERPRFWFPLLTMMVVTSSTAAILHQRAILPMIESAWDQQVADGKLAAEQVDQMVAFMSSPAGLAIAVAQQAVLFPVILLAGALMAWFGVGFLLGARLKFRLAFEVVCWAWLVRLPEMLLVTALAWAAGTMEGVHTGLGALVPVAEDSGKALGFLVAVLDQIGPLQVWFVVVGVLGAAALSGARLRNVAWVLGGLYLGFATFLAGIGVLLRPAP